MRIIQEPLPSRMFVLFCFATLILMTSSTTPSDDINSRIGDGTRLLPNSTFQVIAKPLSGTDVLVSWRLRGKDTREWYLHVFEDSSLIITARINPKTRQHMLMGLEPSTVYRVVVASLTWEGEMWTSSPVAVQTLEDHVTKTGDESTETSRSIESLTTTKQVYPSLKVRPGTSITTLPGNNIRGFNKERRNSLRLEKVEEGSDANLMTVKEKSARQDTKQNQDDSNGSPGVIKWALIASGSCLVMIILIVVVFFLLHRVQKQSSQYTLRRSSKRESSKRLETPHDQNMEEESLEKQTETKNVEIEGVKNSNENCEAAKIESERDDNLKDGNQGPALLSIPQHFQSRGGNCRSNIYSGISWGSEFDVLDQVEDIYSNETCPPPPQVQANYSKVSMHPRTQSAKWKHGKDSYSIPHTSSSQLSRHMSLQRGKYETRNEQPPPQPFTSTLPHHYNHNSNQTDAEKYHQTNVAGWSSRSNDDDNKSSSILDRVITVTQPDATSKETGVYGNVKIVDQCDVYVNSEQINTNSPPPPIPRR